MSSRKWKFSVTDLNALAAKFPKAVKEVHIPARTELKANYSVIAKLLDCGVEVPGIENVMSSTEESKDESLPAFLGGEKMRESA